MKKGGHEELKVMQSQQKLRENSLVNQSMSSDVLRHSTSKLQLNAPELS
jgi:hypothetical protein